MEARAYSAKVGTGFAKRVRASYKWEHFLAANRIPLCRKMLWRRYLNAHVSQDGWPVLVLNADFRPLSYYPLSLWSWQDAIKEVFLDRVNIVEHYDRAVRSPSFEIKLLSVVSLKSFVNPPTHPASPRFTVSLRARFACQYCSADD